MRHFVLLLMALCLLGVGSGVSAADLEGMIAPVAADAFVPVTEGTRHIDRTIDGSGLVGENLTKSDWSADADAPQHAAPGWDQVWEAAYSEGSTAWTRENAWAAWNLGGTTDLQGMRVWNADLGDATYPRQTLSVDIWVSSLETPGNPIDDAANWTMIQDDLNIQAASDIGVYKDLGSTPDVQWVAWTDIDAHAPYLVSHGNDAHYVDVQEIRFFGAAAIPEPSSLVLAGFGLLALLGLCRRRSGK